MTELKVLHINDSKNERGAEKTVMKILVLVISALMRFNYIVHHPQLTDIPKILETPYVGSDKKNKKPPYKHEIEMIKEREFNEHLLEQIVGESAVQS